MVTVETKARNGNNEHLYIARVSWNPFGGYGKGIGEQIESDLGWSEKPKAHLSAAIAFDNAADETIDTWRVVGETTSDDVDRTSLVGEYGLKYRGFPHQQSFTGESMMNVGGKSIIDRGFFVQGGYFLIPKHLEIAGRYSLVDYDNAREAKML